MYTDDRWTDAQDQLLRDNYPNHGGRWKGWAALLPNRTGRAIDARARRIGLVRQRPKCKPRPKRPPAADERHRDREIVFEPDPHEGYVMACMAAGMTPSEIDRRMHWFPGTARLIISGKWERDKAHGQRGNREGAFMTQYTDATTYHKPRFCPNCGRRVMFE